MDQWQFFCVLWMFRYLCVLPCVCVCPVCLPIFVCTHCVLCMLCVHVFLVLWVCPLPCVCANTSGPATETHRWLVQPVNQPTNQAEGPLWKMKFETNHPKCPTKRWCWILTERDIWMKLWEVPLCLIGPRSNLSKLLCWCYAVEIWTTLWIIVLWFQTSFIFSQSTPRMGSLCLWQCLEKWDHHIPWKMASPLKIQTKKDATNASWWLVQPVN